MEISFYLHPRIYQDGSQTVYININYGKEPCAPSHDTNERARVQISTGIKVQTKNKQNWDGAKVKSAEKDYINKNRQLTEWQTKATDIITEHNRLKRVLEKEAFKELLRRQPVVPKPEPKPSPIPVKDCKFYFEQWAYNNRDEVTEKHIKDTRTQLDYLLEFAPGIKPDQLTETFVSDFKEFLRNEKDMLDVSLLKATNMLKHVLKAANMNADQKWLKRKKSGNSKGVLLDLEEQELLRNFHPELYQPKKGEPPLQYQEIETLILAHDLALFLLNTGPRYVDFANLDPSEVKIFKMKDGKTIIKEIYVLEYYQIKGGQKRGTPCRVALNEEAVFYIKKYKGCTDKLFPVPANQNLNPAIQKLCKLAGINSLVKRVRYKSNIRIEETFEKHELVSCHRLRASFAENLLEGGADLKTIQDALGHEDPKSSQTYFQNKDARQYREVLKALDNIRTTTPV